MLQAGQGEENINLQSMGRGSTKGGDSLGAEEAPPYPRIKTNMTQRHRNACGATGSTAQPWQRACCQHTSATLLPSVTFCGHSHGHDKDPGCTLTHPLCHCHWRAQKAAASVPGHKWPHICPLLCTCLWQWHWPDPAGLGPPPGKVRRDGRARKDTAGQQQEQTPLPFLTNKDHLSAQTSHRLHQRWSQLPVMGTTWQLQEQSQSQALKFSPREQL